MNQPTIQQIPADKIIAGLNDRETFNRSELEALAANIAANGLLQPPMYRKQDDGTYQIVLGERRTRAMRDILNMPFITAFITTLNDEEAIAAMGSENRCRVQLNPLEEARGYQAGMARFGWDVPTCASKNGVSTRVVTDRLALLTLCEEAQDLVSKPQSGFTVGYALALASAGLDRNFQNQALDLLKINKAPTLDWFRGIVAELVGKCQQNSMWNPDDFLVMAQAVEVQNETALPDPDTAEAPQVGATAGDILTNQAGWWQDLADQYAGRGKKHEARVCRANARSRRTAADLIARMAAMAPAPVVMAPVVPEPEPAPMAPLPADVVSVDPLVGRVGRRVCAACSKRATHQVARRIATGDGQRKRTELQDVCNDHLPAGVAPQVGPAPQQLQFVAQAA